jgi:membrane-anchored glycerophosphoryl diester phosphodiesterase (GDPDase)
MVEVSATVSLLAFFVFAAPGLSGLPQANTINIISEMANRVVLMVIAVV